MCQAYNVYSQPINPENNMPSKVGPSQLPVPGQTERLPTERVSSSIPKGGTDSTWTYPSPQMFFNALNRKGKGGDVTESDAEVIVAIHNNMNERTWDQLMQWEAPHKERCPHPKLLKFRGRPDELSPLARWKALTGWVGLSLSLPSLSLSLSLSLSVFACLRMCMCMCVARLAF